MLNLEVESGRKHTTTESSETKGGFKVSGKGLVGATRDPHMITPEYPGVKDILADGRCTRSSNRRRTVTQEQAVSTGSGVSWN